MICGIGTDIVDISRFAPWVDYPQERLLKIFSPQELVDCSGGPSAFTQGYGEQVPLQKEAPTKPARGECWPDPSIHFATQNTQDERPVYRTMRACPSLIPEKLAARFAAKEAFFKALSATLERKGLTQKEFSLSFICRTVSVTQTPWGAPQLAVNWQNIHEKINHPLPPLSTHLSLSHDGSMAVAFVVIEE